MILVSMERGDPTLYYGTNQLFFGRVNFKLTEGGNHTPQEDVLKRNFFKKRAQEDEGKSTLIFIQVNFFLQSIP